MIECKKYSIQLGEFKLSDISFHIQSKTYCCLMGKTGCGKTTILESICGLRSINSGDIFIDKVNVTKLRPSQREIGFVPQDGALFSTMTVQDHLEFALKIRKWDKQKIQDRVQELAQLLGISYLLNRKPQGLSGGEKQRVSLGRALTFCPKVLCLDEPLSALDDHTKEEMYFLFDVIRKETGVTALHISHSFEEVSKLADLVLYIEDGKIFQFTPDQYSTLREKIQANGKFI
jgi:molybdate/tungstate transport system ATP-binding protein